MLPYVKQELSRTLSPTLKNHYALLTEVGDLTYLFLFPSLKHFNYTNFKLSLLKETWKIDCGVNESE